MVKVSLYDYHTPVWLNLRQSVVLTGEDLYCTQSISIKIYSLFSRIDVKIQKFLFSGILKPLVLSNSLTILKGIHLKKKKTYIKD